MKLNILFSGISLILLIQGTNAQSTISNGGDYFINSNASLSWTIGEPISETYSTPNNQLTQGFQQPSIVMTAIEETLKAESGVSVFPNPASSIINVKRDFEGNDNVLNVELTDLSGKLIMKETFKDNHGELNLSSYANTFYFLKVSNSENKVIKSFKVQKIY